MKKLVLLPIIICICLLGNSLFASTETLSEPECIALQAKSDSLFAAGVDLYKTKKYQDAIPLFTEADRIDKAILDSTSNRRDYSAMWLASCFYLLGDSAQAAKISPDYYRLSPVDRRLTIESDSLSAIGGTYYKQGEYELALSYLQQAAEVEKQILGEYHIWYGFTLNQIADVYFEEGDYEKTIDYGLKVKKIFEKILWQKQIMYATLMGNLAYTNYLLGNYSEALNYEFIGLDIYKVIGCNSNDYVVSLSNLALYSSELGNYSDAIQIQKQVITILNSAAKQDSDMYVSMLANLAFYYSKINDYAEAIRIESEVLNLREQILGREHPDYMKSLCNLANYNNEKKNYDEAIKWTMDALKILIQTEGVNHPKYIELLYNLAEYNIPLENYAESLQYGLRLKEITHPTKEKEPWLYASSLIILAESYAGLEDYNKAIISTTEVINIIESVVGVDHQDYLVSLVKLANYNLSLGNYEGAILWATKAKDIYDRISDIDKSQYILFLREIADYYYRTLNYTEAIKIGTDLKEIVGQRFGQNNPNYAAALGNLANYNSSVGHYEQAIVLAAEAKEILERIPEKNHYDYAMSLSTLATCYGNVGNYLEAIRLETESNIIIEHLLGKNRDYANSLRELAIYNSEMGNNDLAIRLVSEAIDIVELLYGKDSNKYFPFFNSLANFEMKVGDYEKAIKLRSEILANISKEHMPIDQLTHVVVSIANLISDYTLIRKTIDKRIIEKDETNLFLADSNMLLLGIDLLETAIDIVGIEHPIYASILGVYANLKFELAFFDHAIQMTEEALDIQERVLGKEHPNYITALENLAWYTFAEKNPDVKKYAREATEGNMAFIRKMFGGMTGYERSNFWRTKEYWFNHMLPNFAYGMGTDSLVECAVNGALMSKGLLLNSEIEMTRLLQESGDESALAKYQELRLNRLQLNKLYEKPIAERAIDTDSLEAVVDRLERELVAQSKVYGDYTRNLVIDWRQVQAELGERDAAVEFVRFGVMESDSVMYAAYVTRPGYAVPRMIPLFEARELERLEGFEYEDERLSELVWTPLAEVLTGVERVYFAPAGELYNMAIESAPDWEDPERLMSDRWELYRLSSTRELAVTYDDRTVASASVYGGIDYDRVERGKIKNGRGREGGEMHLSGTRAWLADSLGLRAGVAPLPGTRVEAESVDRSLRGRRVASELLTDSLGSEMSIKALSGLRKGLLHIATHGFYYSEEEIQEMGSHNFLRLEGMQGARYVEDKALTRSGLLMAGANSALKGEAPEDENDGILTAKEISQLDLRGMDLVVLSACQTGLGEVTGDGVFGLQRGFKKAGARSLLMSLWKVDDKATQLLMERFYDNLTAGMSKHAALLDAQRYVREYEEPIDWAGFVLLDGQ